MKHLTDKRIALFVPSLRGGGAERVMLTLANSFADEGYIVDLVLVKAQGELLARAPDSFNIVDLGARRVISSLPALVRYLWRVKPDAMLSALSHANCIAVWANWFNHGKTRLILSEHAHISAATSNSRTMRGRLMPVVMRHAYHKADGLVAVSAGVADDLARAIRMPRDRIKVLYNPVITAHMLSLSYESVDNAWFDKGQPPVFLSVGRLTAQKNYPTLLKAFARLRNERTARLVILGEGEERQRLERLAGELGIQGEVALPGFVSNPYTYMRAAAVFVLSSRYEGLPTVLIEAMACGTPVVSTDCRSGPAEILADGVWGELVPVGDFDALARAMRSQLDARALDASGEYKSHVQKFTDIAATHGYLELMELLETSKSDTCGTAESEER